MALSIQSLLHICFAFLQHYMLRRISLCACVLGGQWQGRVVLFEERRDGRDVCSHGGVCVPRYDLRSPASVKKAARESLEMGKQAVEHAAESAAETLGKTTVKLKRKVSPPPGRHLDGDL
uniref:Uncharacterized protein n=1 Tax=Oryza brachyantha TaxID=4533 RepID=J3MN71_ORYBR